MQNQVSSLLNCKQQMISKCVKVARVVDPTKKARSVIFFSCNATFALKYRVYQKVSPKSNFRFLIKMSTTVTFR